MILKRLLQIVPDISQQESREAEETTEYSKYKRRALQAFQCELMLRSIAYLTKKNITVVDVGDSAGTHMLYLKELVNKGCEIDTLSVNLDPRAIEKIKARGLAALCCRAEDLKLDQKVDLFTSFEMLEHLHNPALFLRRLAKRQDDSLLLLTVPYVRRSRVGLHFVRRGLEGPVYAEDEHIFELSPTDWILLMKHSGWSVLFTSIHYQYPRWWPGWAWFWRRTDFEGFWGVLLKKDTKISDRYQDWES